MQHIHYNAKARKILKPSNLIGAHIYIYIVISLLDQSQHQTKPNQYTLVKKNNI